MRVLLTGGAGFIGCNAAARLLGRGDETVVLDDLSRPSAPVNLEWLRARPDADRLEFIHADVRDAAAVARAMDGADVVLHLAAQVAVTASLADPRADFEVNALGTLNVLEAARTAARPPLVVYASTNKVYGRLDAVPLETTPTRYQGPAGGVDESQPLDFHSPYGCSKGCGDQYVRDYHRVFGLPTVVLRQSCIYGQRQLGVEDQGWVAWFLIAALTGRRLVVYGDGRQVRDLLWIDDLLDAYDAAIAHIDRAAGQVYNLGGGPERALSVWVELGPRLERLLGRPLAVDHADWRAGDQRFFVADIGKAERELGWRPRVGLDEGLERLLAWLKANRDLL